VRAVVLDRHGGSDVLTVRETPDPIAGPDEVLVRVAATALNRADLLQREGRYPQPGAKPVAEIPGLEFAGVVESVGERVTSARAGDRVMGLLAGGGYAEKVSTHERMLLPVPDGMSLEEAASIPEVFFTAYDALFPQAGCTLGDRVLVHAGGSGVGIAATQLAVAAGAMVVVTLGSAEKGERAIALGAMTAINYHDGGFAERVLRETGGHGADIILDVVGAPYLEENLKAAALGGRLIFIGTMGGAAGTLNLGALLGKRLRLFGTTLRSRPLEAKIALTQAFKAHALPLFRTGQLRPVVDSTFGLDEAAAAHDYMAANRNFGKIVLRVAVER
jgi:putative PIG3 family NAD(P)H quinone oxidoreductase